MNITKSPGMLCLSIYLILIGLSALVPSLVGLGMIPALLALLAGIFLLIGK